jgi:nucleotide-binding universal stress UspA family protein
VGVDGSAGSVAAATWAAGCAKAVGSDLVIAAVAPDEHEAREVEVLVEGEWAQPASRAGCSYDCVVATGDPRVAIPQLAASRDAALVVVGVGSERWFPALHLGSTSHYLAHHLDRPICVVPPAHPVFNPSHVLVGLDGSAGSAAAAGWSCDMATEAGGKVTALLAWTPSARRVARLTNLNSESEAEETCREWAGLLDASGVLLDCRVMKGDPVAVIAGCAEDYGATMIALGTRGSGGFHDLRLGSVALRVLQGAVLPTVLVPPVR